MRAYFNKGLSTTEEERAEHIRAMGTLLSREDADAIHSWIHENLIILDSKAQSILGLLSLALATLTIFYASLGPETPSLIILAVLLEFLIIAWSIVPLARISFVYWSTTEEFGDPERLLVDLLRLRDQRTRIIRMTLVKSSASLVLFIVILAWDILTKV